VKLTPGLFSLKGYPVKKIFALMMVLSLAAIGCDDKKTSGSKPGGTGTGESKKSEEKKTITPDGGRVEEKKTEEKKLTPEGKLEEKKTEEKKVEPGPKVDPPKGK
jgi:hypothetical protein